jgi:hypothetical protein
VGDPQCSFPSDGCLTIGVDDDMSGMIEDDEVNDGICTELCTSAADCSAAPAGCSATPVCDVLSATQSACALACDVQDDCPIGMTCQSVDNNGRCY